MQQTKPHRTVSKKEVYEQAWWVTVTTEQPDYEYFFGPFEEKEEAEANLSGYVRDLSDEGATQIKSTICWCQPKAITTALIPLSA